ARELAPDDTRLELEMVNLLQDKGDFDRALATAWRVVRRQPGHMQALISIAVTHRRAARHPAALAAFQEALRHHPGDLDIPVEMAIEERALGRPLDARRRLTEVVDRDPTHAAALLELAELARLSRSFEEAVTLCERALAHAPWNLKA